MEATALAERLRDRFPDAVATRGEVTVVVSPDQLSETLRFLTDEPELSFDFLSDITATDRPDREPRFWVAYHLYSMQRRHRLRVKVGLPGSEPTVPSVTALHPTADWFERELWDFFGIRFEGHPDLRRIIMPDDWEGHPLRKDETLGGVRTQYKGAFIPPVDQRSP